MKSTKEIKSAKLKRTGVDVAAAIRRTAAQLRLNIVCDRRNGARIRMINVSFGAKDTPVWHGPNTGP